MISLHCLIALDNQTKTLPLWVTIHTAHHNSITRMFFGEFEKTSSNQYYMHNIILISNNLHSFDNTNKYFLQSSNVNCFISEYINQIKHQIIINRLVYKKANQ